MRIMAFPIAVAASVLIWLTNSGCAPKEISNVPEDIRYVVGLSPFLENEEKDTVYQKLTSLLLEGLPLNSSLWVYDAYHIRTIAQMEVPNVRAFRSGKTRANQYKDQIQAVRRFLAEEHSPPEVSDLSFDRAVRFPQFMKFVGENLAGPNHSVTVIVLGNPLYIDYKERGFSMVNGYFPSDGHLLATEEKSIFGIKGRDKNLKDFIVHLGYFGDPWVSEIHHEKIDRFWTLFLKGQGATMATMCGDLPTIFNAARKSGTTSDSRNRRHNIEPNDSKIEMLRISRHAGITDWITSEAPANIQNRPPRKTVGQLKIGIRWRRDIDLDLYSKPKDSSETLFFENTSSAEGFYFKDHRSSPEREYEFIEFEVPVNVWEVEAMINFYEGRLSSGPSGEVRIEFEGKIYVGNFSLKANRGNEGRSGRSQSEYWAEIDVPKILMLR